MPILNLNGTDRKHAKPIAGDVFRQVSAHQHPATGVVGKSYAAPFTHSGAPPMATAINTATQPQLPALKMETPGVVVPVNDFTRVSPHEKGMHFTVSNAVQIVNTGGYGAPTKKNDTAKTPNQRAQPTPHPPRKPHIAVEKLAVRQGSFLPTATQHLASHSNADINKSRWATVKRGAAG